MKPGWMDKNKWKKKFPEDSVEPCPFCGSKSVTAIHKQDRFLGENGRGVVKLKMKCYCQCAKCYARSKPVSYTGYTNSNYGTNLYDDGMKELAKEQWNRRCNEHE